VFQSFKLFEEIGTQTSLTSPAFSNIEAVAVGSRDFVEKVRSELGIKALHREPEQVDGTYTLREPGDAYRANLTSKVRL
jgi:hypothetical protein